MIKARRLSNTVFISSKMTSIPPLTFGSLPSLEPIPKSLTTDPPEFSDPNDIWYDDRSQCPTPPGSVITHVIPKIGAFTEQGFRTIPMLRWNSPISSKEAKVLKSAGKLPERITSVHYVDTDRAKCFGTLCRFPVRINRFVADKREVVTEITNGNTVTQLDMKGRKIRDTVYSEGKIHSDFGPAVILYDYDGLIISEAWYRNGKLHNSSGPSRIEYHDTLVVFEAWHRDGKLHRDGKPARHGADFVEYYQKDKLHRIGEPAVREYENDRLTVEKWYYKGMLHRTDGPAKIKYINGKKIESWYQYGLKK